jgi:hypothetical protein
MRLGVHLPVAGKGASPETILQVAVEADENCRLNALDMEVHRLRTIYNTIRPHQALGDRTPSAAYTCCCQRKTAR